MITRNIKILILLSAICSCGSDNSQHNMKDMTDENYADQEIVYTCPMHPEIKRSEPGSCPICGMNLVIKKSDGGKSGEKNLDILLKPTNTYALSQVKTITATTRSLPVQINANGTITYDTREISVVSARVSGRIEKLYVKYRFQPVVVGQKLMDIYSKELVTEQENFIYLLNSDPDNISLIKTAENRLLLQGLTNNQVNQLRQSRQPFNFISIYSPYSGHLHDLSSLPMSSMNSDAVTELAIKEGIYVQKGQSVFNVFNTNSIWAVLSIYADKINLIKVGQKVKLTINNVQIGNGNLKVDFIEPEIRPGQNSIAVRVYIANPDNMLKIGSNIYATIESGTRNGIFIPQASLIKLGNSNVIFVKDNQIFRAQNVQIGIETNGLAEIVSGLAENDILAENAQMLIDSESFIKSENK